METTFIYKGKTITTPNLEKKLKRLKITIDDIQIVDTPIKKKQEDTVIEIPIENYHAYKLNDKEWHIFITDNPTDTILFNNQLLERDVAYEAKFQRTLRSQFKNGQNSEQNL